MKGPLIYLLVNKIIVVLRDNIMLFGRTGIRGRLSPTFFVTYGPIDPQVDRFWFNDSWFQS